MSKTQGRQPQLNARCFHELVAPGTHFIQVLQAMHRLNGCPEADTSELEKPSAPPQPQPPSRSSSPAEAAMRYKSECCCQLSMHRFQLINCDVELGFLYTCVSSRSQRS